MKKICAILLAVFCLTTLFGCDEVPSEGEKEYNRILGLMSPIEKVIYFRVANQWPEKSLRPLRDAISKRQNIPVDGMIPFSDAATVIIYINDTDFKNSPKISIARYRLLTFEAINSVWYEQIKQCAQNNCQCNYNQLSEQQKKVLEQESEKKKPETPPKVDKTQSNIDAVNPATILSYEEYNILLKEVTSCPYAIDLVRKKMREQRFLFTSDRDDILKEVMLCKSMELQSQVLGSGQKKD